MRNSYLEVTYRNGRPLAAYYYLPRRSSDKSVRTVPESDGLLVDFADDGRAIGIEISSPSQVNLPRLNELLVRLGHEEVQETDFAPLSAA